MSRTLRVVVENQKNVNSREEVIVKSIALRKSDDKDDYKRKRKLKVIDVNFDGINVHIQRN